MLSDMCRLNKGCCAGAAVCGVVKCGEASVVYLWRSPRMHTLCKLTLKPWSLLFRLLSEGYLRLRQMLLPMRRAALLLLCGVLFGGVCESACWSSSGRFG
jgi:hypothetical protein